MAQHFKFNTMSSYTISESQTFTVTNARYIASKVVTDLMRLQRFYAHGSNCPSDSRIAEFETEITELLKKGYLGTVTYGFKKDENWIEPTLRYTAKDLDEITASDDDPGRVRPGANIDGASFHSYLTRSQAWHNLTQAERDNFENTLPFKRTVAAEPGISGYLSNDKTYSSGGRSLERSTVKSY